MAIKILSVDDELDLEILLTQYFRRKIRKGEYEFTFAHNGLEALRLVLEKKDFDIILSDINMPEMDGLTLLTKINEMRNPALKCIMVSAYGDMARLCPLALLSTVVGVSVSFSALFPSFRRTVASTPLFPFIGLLPMLYTYTRNSLSAPDAEI